ncbi:MAG: hypothetical protein FWD67_09225 [Betaproteobacteria bacterium]|nr:hypothetical protein [Betaproteobacteria bacterium]
MTPLHKAIRIFVILSLVGITAGQISSSQADEQTEEYILSPEEKEFSKAASKEFLEFFGVSSDKFESSPPDIQRFVEYARDCEHFAGEEPYDVERNKEILNGLKANCSAAQNKLEQLKAKYKDPYIKRFLTVCEKGSDAACASFDSTLIIE